MPFPPRPVLTELCSPKFLGRGYVNDGDRKAGAWLEDRFRAAGLQPAGQGGFRQEFTHTVNVFKKEPILKINGKKIPIGHWIPDAASRRINLNTYIPNYRSVLLFTTAKGYQQKTIQSSLQENPPYLVIIKDQKITSTIADHELNYGMIRYDSTISFNGNLKIRIKLKPTLKQHSSFNVIAQVPGTARPDSFLIVSAHYDHLGGLGKKVYLPGANDNASGTTMLLELASYYAQHPGRYTLVFIAFAGEEAGLLGSRYFVEHPTVDLKKVRFMLNLDLLGSGETGGTLVNAPAVQPDFNLLKSINDSLHLLPRLKPRRNAPNSDHYYFAEAGVPAMFLYLEGPYTHYHDVYDRPEALSLAGFEGTFQLLNRFLMALQGQSL